MLEEMTADPVTVLLGGGGVCSKDGPDDWDSQVAKLFFAVAPLTNSYCQNIVIYEWDPKNIEMG